MLGKGAAGECYSGIYFAGSGSRNSIAGWYAGLCVGHCHQTSPTPGQEQLLPLGLSDVGNVLGIAVPAKVPEGVTQVCCKSYLSL